MSDEFLSDKIIAINSMQNKKYLSIKEKISLELEKDGLYMDEALSILISLYLDGLTFIVMTYSEKEEYDAKFSKAISILDIMFKDRLELLKKLEDKK